MLDVVNSLKIRRTSWEKVDKFIILTKDDIQACYYGRVNVPYRLSIDDLRANDWITHKEETDASTT